MECLQWRWSFAARIRRVKVVCWGPADESEVTSHVWLSYTSSRADESEVTSHVWLSYTSSSGVIELVFHFASTKWIVSGRQLFCAVPDLDEIDVKDQFAAVTYRYIQYTLIPPTLTP